MEAVITAPGAQLRERWQEYQLNHPKVRIRDAATALGVSEAELVACNVGHGTLRLRKDFAALLPRIETLGRVMALTRNDHVVHERHGEYLGVQVRIGHGGTALVLGEEIDLRVFLNHWHFGFAVSEGPADALRHSLQFFDADGTAVHKIYMTQHSDMTQYQALVTQFQAPEQDDALSLSPVKSLRFHSADDDIDAQALRDGWDALKDTHDFFPLLRRLKVDRLQALVLAGPTRARQVGTDALQALFALAAEKDIDIMVFVGSAGVIQIHSGKVRKLVTVGDWFNVLDPDFNLHVRSHAIASSWVVRKPTEDGVVTSLECFDEDGNLLVQCFGKRKPGIAENPAWQAIVAQVETP